jgi:hypothetical protein
MLTLFLAHDFSIIWVPIFFTIGVSEEVIPNATLDINVFITITINTSAGDLLVSVSALTFLNI